MSVNLSVYPCANTQIDPNVVSNIGPRVAPDTEPSKFTDANQNQITVDTLTVFLSSSSVDSNFVSNVHPGSNSSVGTSDNPSLGTGADTSIITNSPRC